MTKPGTGLHGEVRTSWSPRDHHDLPPPFAGKRYQSRLEGFQGVSVSLTTRGRDVSTLDVADCTYDEALRLAGRNVVGWRVSKHSLLAAAPLDVM